MVALLMVNIDPDHVKLLEAIRQFYAVADGNGTAPSLEESVEMAIVAMAERALGDRPAGCFERRRQANAAEAEVTRSQVETQVHQLRRTHRPRIIRLS
jgi:hypothetical protein